MQFIEGIVNKLKTGERLEYSYSKIIVSLV